jgi:hypothetical protein
MSVRVDTRTGLTIGPPSRLFPTRIDPNGNVPQYAVTADGQRFLGLEGGPSNNSFTFVIDWLKAPPTTTRMAQ